DRPRLPGRVGAAAGRAPGGRRAGGGRGAAGAALRVRGRRQGAGVRGGGAAPRGRAVGGRAHGAARGVPARPRAGPDRAQAAGGRPDVRGGRLPPGVRAGGRRGRGEPEPLPGGGASATRAALRGAHGAHSGLKRSNVSPQARQVLISRHSVEPKAFRRRVSGWSQRGQRTGASSAISTRPPWRAGGAMPKARSFSLAASVMSSDVQGGLSAVTTLTATPSADTASATDASITCRAGQAENVGVITTSSAVPPDAPSTARTERTTPSSTTFTAGSSGSATPRSASQAAATRADPSRADAPDASAPGAARRPGTSSPCPADAARAAAPGTWEGLPTPPPRGGRARPTGASRGARRAGAARGPGR